MGELGLLGMTVPAEWGGSRSDDLNPAATGHAIGDTIMLSVDPADVVLISNR